MRRKLLIWSIAVLCLSVAPTMAGTFPSSLQGVLDGITTAPVPGDSSVNVATDMIADNLDSYWEITGSSLSASTIIFELTGTTYDVQSFGVFDYADPTNYVELFDGTDLAGSQATLSIKADGSVHVNLVDTLTDFSGNLFGYYFDSTGCCASGGGFWHSDTALNSDSGDHMYAYQGNNIDFVQVPGGSPGLWTSNEYILAFECGVLSASDQDYDDLVVMVESVRPIPVPAAVILGILGLGAAGLKLRRKES